MLLCEDSHERSPKGTGVVVFDLSIAAAFKSLKQAPFRLDEFKFGLSGQILRFPTLSVVIRVGALTHPCQQQRRPTSRFQRKYGAFGAADVSPSRGRSRSKTGINPKTLLMKNTFPSPYPCIEICLAPISKRFVDCFKTVLY